jgi:catechol 2,3-dioxygenase-like lactoylglutathione lyase family enzyme
MARLARVAPELPAANLVAALAFYERLGFAPPGDAPIRDYAIVERDGVALHLFEDRQRRVTPVGVHIFTPELTELHEEFEDRGVRFAQKIERKPWGNREFRVRDDFGNELKFTESITDDD